MTVYLNTYETSQAYGGPEEGGWWYECGTPVQSVAISGDDLEEWLEAHTPEERQEMLARATHQYTQGQAPTPAETGYGGYTFAIGSDVPSTYREDNSFRSCFEDTFAVDFPQERPYYC